MKWLVVENIKGVSGNVPLTLGARYLATEELQVFASFYNIKADDGEFHLFESWRFRDLTKDELREVRLGELGI